MSEKTNRAELRIFEGLDDFELELIILTFLAGLSKTQLSKNIFSEKYQESHHSVITGMLISIQLRVANLIQRSWEDGVYGKVYKDLRSSIEQKKIEESRSQNTDVSEEKEYRPALNIFQELPKFQLQLIIAAFLSGLSKTQLTKNIFSGKYQREYHIKVTQKLITTQKNIAEAMEDQWDDETYEQIHTSFRSLVGQEN